MIVPSTSAAAWSASGTASRSSSCQHERPADAGEFVRRCGAGRAQRVEVDVVALADAGGDDARAAVVDDHGFAALAAQLARARELGEPAVEPGLGRLRDRNGEGVGLSPAPAARCRS